MKCIVFCAPSEVSFACPWSKLWDTTVLVRVKRNTKMLFTLRIILSTKKEFDLEMRLGHSAFPIILLIIAVHGGTF